MPDRNGYIGRAPSDSSITIARQINQPTSTTSTFVFNSGYDVGYLDVYVNGSKLVNVIEYAATDTQNITLTTAVGNGDKVEFVAYKAFNLSRIVSSTLDNLTVNGDITCENINSSGIVTATTFIGALTGNVTGNTSGTAGGLTGTPNISCGTGAFSGAVTLQDDLDLQDNDKILLGSGDDLQIFHDGSNSNIKDVGTGHLQIFADDLFILKSDGSETKAQFNSDGNVRLFYDATEKFKTKSDGVDITGELECDSLDVDGDADITGTTNFHGNVDLQDNDYLRIGSSDDLQIYHNAIDSVITDSSRNLLVRSEGSGDLFLQSDTQVILSDIGGNETFIECNDNSDVKLFHDNSEKLATTATGVTVTGTLNATTDVQINGKGVATTGKSIAMSMVFG